MKIEKSHQRVSTIKNLVGRNSKISQRVSTIKNLVGGNITTTLQNGWLDVCVCVSFIRGEGGRGLDSMFEDI